MKSRDNVIVTFLLLAVIFTLTGCVSMEKEPSEAAIKKREQLKQEAISGNIEGVAIQFKDDFFNGIQKSDYNLFSKNFTPELKEKFSRKNFPKFCKSFTDSNGKIERCEYMGELDRYITHVFVWKIRFEKDMIKLKDGTKVPRDRMFYIIVGKVDGQYRMFLAMFV